MTSIDDATLARSMPPASAAGESRKAALAAQDRAVITFAGVNHAFGDAERGSAVPVVRDVDLVIEKGEFVSLIGPSGCGKSTLLGMASGFLTPNGGAVRLFNEEPAKMRKHLGMVFQAFSLLPWRTVIDNITLGLEFRGVGKAERMAHAQGLIDSLGLRGFEQRFPRELSGGMNQRVTLARALVLKPDILLLDEPFGSLDEQTRMLVGGELQKLWEQMHPTTVLVTHSIAEAVRLSTRVVVLTARPTAVKKIISIDIKGPRTGASTVALEEEIWDLLKDEATRAMLGNAGAGDGK
jgi:NitT/TauT family transport system ATP-binding protein